MHAKILVRRAFAPAVALIALANPNALAAAPPPVRGATPIVAAAYSQLVRDLQAALNERGYDAGPTDGYFGARTEAAIRDYQRDNNLLINGRASSTLLQHARQARPSNNVEQQGQAERRREIIERTQERLESLGYSVRKTGELDWQTRLAISDFQRDNKMQVDGELDSEVAERLRALTDNADRLSTAQLMDIERGLDARGYNVGRVDGDIDAKAKAAIEAYQRDRGDPATGEVSAELARQLAVGLGPSLTTPKTIAAVQSKLNEIGYDAGPADGVMGPSTRNAILDYREENNLPASNAISQDLIDSLENAEPRDVADASKPSSGKPSGRPAISFRTLMADDFEDGDFTRNPNWQVYAGEFQVVNGYLSVKLPDAAARANAANQNAATQFLNQALGVRVRSPEAVAAIAQGTGIQNAFKIELTLLGSARDAVQMHVGPYFGSDLTAGYRLVFDEEAGDRLAIVARTSGETVALAEKLGVGELGDGGRHTVEWTRNRSGQMVVRVDGKEHIRVQDRSITGTFSGLSFVNLAGAWNIHDIAAFAYE